MGKMKDQFVAGIKEGAKGKNPDGTSRGTWFEKHAGPVTIQDLMQPDGSLRCTCGSTQFKAQRSTGRKVAFGFASLLGSTNEVKCLVCGRKFKRGDPWAAMKEPAPQRPDK